MFLDPDVGKSIVIDGNSYTFIQVPETPGIVYAEMGKKAKVYRVMQQAEAYALKVFRPVYRNPKTLANTDLIKGFKNVPGLAVAERVVLTPEKHPALINDHPEYAYAVLMPWIEGKAWSNYISGKIAINRNESLRLAKALVGIMRGLEERDIAHCDLSGGNFIFSTDFNHVELIDIEELFGIGLQRPNPLPAGTSGYSPEWVKQNGLWEVGADRFATAILTSEILGWQYDAVRSKSSLGDTFFAEGEFGHNTNRYKLLQEYLGQLNSLLPTLLNAVWNATNIEDCPRIAEWEHALAQIPEEEMALGWEWEPLDLPVDIGTPEPAALEPTQVVDPKDNYPPTRSVRSEHEHTCPACGREVQIGQTQCPFCWYEFVHGSEVPIQPPAVEKIIPQTGLRKDPVVTAKPWPVNGGGMAIRRHALLRVFMIFAGLGIVLLLLILISGNSITQIAYQLVPQSGMIIPHAISNGLLALLVGSVQAWIYRNNMRRSRVLQYILASVMGGVVGGIVAGGAANLGIVKDSLSTGALIGVLAGTISSLWQNVFMRSSSLRIKWLLFSMITWTIIWAIGMTISWSLGSTISMAVAGAFIMIGSGAALSLFLYKSPEIEF